MTAPELITFGCRINAFETEVMRGFASKAGGDTVIVNTCAVTAEAERQARQAIRRARRQKPKARIIVTGCAAQINPKAYAAMDEVDQVLGNAEKLEAASFLDTETPVLVNDIMSVRETAGHLIEGLEGRARAFLQVQQGCDHRCTFCIIPYGRGPSRSVGAGEIVDQAKRLVDNGYAEIVLTGVDITSYGADLPGSPTLGSMMMRLLKAVPELARLRVSSIDAVEVDEDFLSLIADEPRLMPHLHLSLQAGDDMILKRMKRRHDRAQAVEFCGRIREARPGIVFGADLIAGFPTETDDMFANTLSLIVDCGLTYLHVFPYSARPGTPAAEMPEVPHEVRKARARILREAGEAAQARTFDQLVGREVHVLLETPKRGRSEGFATVNFAEDAGAAGEIVGAAVQASNGETLTARRAL